MPSDPLELDARQVARGNTVAFRSIVERTQRRLVRLALRVLGDPGEAEDAVQESFVKAHQALVSGRFDGRSSVETWLYRIVTRTAVDAARRGSRRKRLRDALEVEPQASSIEAHLALRELSAWLVELPKDQHAALLLQAVEGFSSAEVAEILECSEGAVEQRLVRARATLRRRSREAGSATEQALWTLLSRRGEHAPA
jgi:RNA polymerase sigma-70 factor (ECF subfamily)